MTEVQIRVAALTELDQIVEITNAAYAKYIPRIKRKPQPMTADYGALIAAGSVWVALEAEPASNIAGLIVLQPENAHLLIYSVAVHPARQGAGIGRRLLEFAEQQAVALGYDKIQLYTNETMVENISLYQRIGYSEVTRAEYKGFHIVYMEKGLD